MNMEVGRLCVKTAGRDARRKCVVIDVLENSYVMVDGQTRRRKVNIAHLEPMNQVIKIKKGASREEVAKAFEELGIETKASTPKEKTERPRKQRKVREKPEQKKGAKKKEAKEEKKAKEAPKAESKKEETKEKHGDIQEKPKEKPQTEEK